MAQDQKTLRAGFMAFLGRQGEGVEFGKQIKSLALNALRSPAKAMSFISSTTDLIKRDQEIIDGWTPLSEFISRGGAFSGFDLRYWIELAKMAGVPFIPADPVLTLTDAEASILSGEFNIDQMIGPFEKHRQNLVDLINEQFPDLEAPEPNQISKSEKAALIERLFSAMDDLPANIMIRGVETGPSILKTLVGVGIIEGRAPEVPAAPGDNRVWFGPGWIRIGNRRMIQVNDLRTLKAHCEGDINGDHIYLARPWTKPSRWLHGVDPHTVGTRLEDPEGGRWPVEWRAFVYNGKVTAVSAYYAWAGQVTQEDARSALLVRERAQAICDAAASIGAFAQIKRIEAMRSSPLLGDIADQDLPAGRTHATIDFIETADVTGKPDIVMLEAGPPFHPLLSGGAPCAFSGTYYPEGVAFKPMEGVEMAEPSTFCDRPQEIFEKRKALGTIREMHDYGSLKRDGSIFTWEDVQNIAMNGAPETGHEMKPE